MNSISEEKKKISIFVVCHKDSFVPQNPYLFPIQVGAAIGKQRLNNMFHDDEGDNISIKNHEYCELTAQYWAWKNFDADYYGFFHYRRYMSFDPDLIPDERYGNVEFENISDKALETIKLEPECMEQIICSHDIISVNERILKDKDGISEITAYEEYGSAFFQHKEDLDIALNILYTKYPEYKEAAEKYMNGSHVHECNMFIMRKDLFHKYCSWLFDILFEAEKKIDMTWYSQQEHRVIGYIAERLCGIFYTYEKMQNMNCMELPKTLFVNTDIHRDIKPVFEEEIPIVLAANNYYVPYLTVMIQSIYENSNQLRNYDLVVLHDNISDLNQKKIVDIYNCHTNFKVRFSNVRGYFNSDKLFVDQHLSIETYYRFIVSHIMKGYHKILYLDCDMVVNHDVAELYDIDISDNIIGAVRDIDVAGQIKMKVNKWNHYVTYEINLKQPFDYFQAGVLIINLDALSQKITAQELIEIAEGKQWRCHDQDVLNYVCQGKIFYLPQYWNVMMNWWENDGRCRIDILKNAPDVIYQEYLEARKEPYIIHFAGYQKPWDVVDCDMAEYFWRYAKNTDWYLMLLQDIKRTLIHGYIPNRNEMETVCVPGYVHLLNKILPKGTPLRNGVRKIHHAINPKFES